MSIPGASLHHLWPTSVRWQLILGVALVHLVLMTFFVFDLVDRQRHFLREQLQSHAESVVSTLAINSTSWVLAADVAGLEEIVQSLRHSPGLRYAMVLSPNGTVLAHTDPTRIGRRLVDATSRILEGAAPSPRLLRADADGLDLATPIVTSTGRCIGWARIGLSQEEIVRNLRLVTRNGVGYTFLAIAVGSLLAFIIGSQLTAELERLLLVSGQIRDGRRDRRMGESRTGEVARLGAGLNEMIDTLQASESALRRSAEEFQDIYDNAPCGYHALGPDGTFLRVNDTELKWLGYRREELVGRRKFTDLLTPAGRELFDREFEAFKLRGRVHDLEFDLVRKDGSVLPVLLSASAITDGAGRFVMSRSVLHDMTDRLRAEGALRESETRYRRFFDEDLAGNCVKLPSGQISSCNRAFARMFGFASIAEAINTDIRDLYRDPQQRLQLLERVRRDGKVEQMELAMQRRDGTAIHILENAVGVFSPDGELQEIHSYAFDITERDRAEEALRRFGAYNRSLIEASLDPLVTIGTDGRITDVNGATEVLTGYTRPELIGTDFSDYFTVPEAARAGYQQAFREGLVRDYPLELRHRDGQITSVIYNASIYRNERGEVSGVFAAARDITQRKRAEEEREQYFRLFMTSSDLMVITNAKGNFLKTNPACARTLGYSESELAARPFIDFVHPDDRQATLDEVVRQQQLGFTNNFENRYVCKNGAYRWLAWRATFNREDGLAYATARDITEERHATEALRQSEERFRLFYVHSPIAYQSLDAAGLLMDVNESWLELSGYDRAEVLGRSFGEFLAAEQGELLRQRFAEFLSSGSVAGAAFDLRCKDGRVVSVLLDGRVGHTPAGEFKQAHCVLHNVTEIKRAADALRRSEKRFRTLVENSPDLIVRYDRECRRVYVNPGFLRAAATTESTLLGRTPTEYSPLAPAAAAALQDLLHRVLNCGAPAEMDVDWRQEAGSRHYAVRAVPEFGDTSAVESVLCFFRDITERKSAETELRKLSRAVEQTPATVIITDCEGVIEYVNPSFAATTGYTLAEVRGRNPGVLSSGELPAEAYRTLWDTIKSGREWRGEFHNRKKNGELFWEAATISPITDAAGRITHFLAVEEDITERKRAEDRIREQAALLDWTRDAIVVVTLEQVVTYWNRGAELVFGWTAAESVGRVLESVLYRAAPADFTVEWRTLFEQGEAARESRPTTKTGREIIVQSRATLMRGPQGEPKAVLIVATDVTETKRLELQYLRAQRLESLGALASGVAHDLNNVLTPVLMAAEMLRPLAQSPADRETVQLLSGSARRGAEIVRQLLLFGRGSDSPRSAVSVRDLMSDIGHMVGQTFPKTITLSMQEPKDLWQVHGDSTQLHQVLLNLCVNARDAMPKGGRLSLLAENVRLDDAFVKRGIGGRPGPHVHICVTDTGMGIPATHLDKIFDPFFTTKPVGQGTGLGLAAVLGIIRSHGGFVTVQSQEGVGSAFSVYLPVATESREAVASEAPTGNRRGQQELVLVVDDEENIRVLLRRALIAHNYRVLTARDGREALSIAAGQVAELRLVITDVMMPGLGGADTISGLRRLKPDLPVLVVSGLPGHRAELERNFGPQIRFLPKPFLVDQALALARELLESSPGTAVTS